MPLAPDFTPLPALVGGLIIGGASAMLLLLRGRLAGVSSLVGGLFSGAAGERGFRAAFVAGLVAGGLALALLRPASFDASPSGSWLHLGLAGVLVGFGSRLSGGCTSGHGVCGLSRFSSRSLIAVLTFMATGAGAVFVAGHLLAAGGSP